MENEKIIKYLEKRGFSEEIIKDWNLVPTTNEVLINYLDPGGALLYARRNRPGKNLLSYIFHLFQMFHSY